MRLIIVFLSSIHHEWFFVVDDDEDCDGYAMKSSGHSLLKNGFGFGGIVSRTLPEEMGFPAFRVEELADSDERWMTQALFEAMNGVGWSAPNPSVGCVIVSGGKMIAAGFTQQYGGKHAERMAFESLNEMIEGYSNLEVYITLEPCSHSGRQPPCVDLLLHPAVRRVVIGCEDPNPLVKGEGIRKLISHSKEVKVGVLLNEVRAWHFPFLHRHLIGRPLWVAKWAENKEGLLADSNGDSKWITNPMSRAHTHWLRQKYDAILVGAGTWIRDRPRLTVRDCAFPHRRNPVILIHDPLSKVRTDEIPKGAWIFKDQTIQGLVNSVEGFDFGFELQSIFCEGGARTLNELFAEGSIHLVHRFVGDKFLGASKHRITAFNPESESSDWRLGSTHEFGNDLLQEWVKCF